MIRKEAVVAILGSPIAYYTAFARVLGGVEAGILTSQFFYWYGKGHHPEGWIYKTQAEIEDETGLSRRNQETARKKLRELGVLEEQYTGMPAKLYYRLNLDKLFTLMNDWFSEEVLQEDVYQDEIEEDTPLELQDVRIRHPSKREPAIQASANPPSKDVRIRHPSKREPAIQVSANPPSIDGGSRHSNTKTTTKTTAKSTTETTTPTSIPLFTSEAAVNVPVTGSDSILPGWISEQFQLLLGSKRAVNSVDQAVLIELSAYPDHIIQQALDAAREWLRKPNQKPIHSLARWLVGTAQRKWEAEQERGSTVTALADERKYAWNSGMETWQEEPDLPDQIPDPEYFTHEKQIWQTVLQELALQLPKATYESWLRDSILVTTMDDVYEIGLPHSQAKEWLENRLAPTVRRTLASLLGHPVTIRFHVMPSE